VSDLSAASQTDLLFAKEGHGMVRSDSLVPLGAVSDLSNSLDLITYCERENIPFTVFSDWSSILATTAAIHEGKTTAQEVARKLN
jgi:2-hydroxy-3-keto-5-methylthiopentenyl-1-phosphate phosphatase